MSKCINICLKDGLFRGFAAQHCLINNRKPSGQDDGIGKCRELLPTPHMIADESTSLYGVSQVISSHKTTPYDLKVQKLLYNFLIETFLNKIRSLLKKLILHY